MSSISELMLSDHRACDDIYAQTEDAVGEGDFTAAARLWGEFCDRVEQHFVLEEQTLFPGFEAVTGMQGGPTMVMRGEHVQIREMFKLVAAAIEQQDADEVLGQCESLMIFIQQHNMKEEQILYPMLDDALPREEMARTINEALA